MRQMWYTLPMILNTGNRTDIPAFYSRWFWNRLKDGFAMARNPMATGRITKFRLDPEVVDVLSFCTKDPAPMLEEMARQKAAWESGQSAGDNRTVADSESVARACGRADLQQMARGTTCSHSGRCGM